MAKITYADIEKANKSIKPLQLKRNAKDKKTGKFIEVVKDYAEVPQRVKAFRQVYPTGAIITELISNENGVVIYKASVYDEETKLIATGTARECKDDSIINSTNYIENCETSAVGRALGFAGFGIDNGIASYEEVSNAIEKQEKKTYCTKEQAEQVRKLLNQEQLNGMFKYYKISCVEALTVQQASEVIKKGATKWMN